MSSTVMRVFGESGCIHGGAVPWGTRPSQTASGIYCVSLSQDPESSDGISSAPVDPALVGELLEAAPGITIDGSAASVEDLATRLAAMWLPDESIVYIGKATSLSARIGQYYKTPLGARSPHAGGWPIKTLSNLFDLWVHWAVSDAPRETENRALDAFVRNVTEVTKASLFDPTHPYPFANLEGPFGRKGHGIRAARGTRKPEAKPSARVQTTKVLEKPREARRQDDMSKRTQNVTAKDIENGRIRIPSVSKHLFPSERTYIDVRLRGTNVNARWDPRLGPKERSGTIGIGRQVLPSLVRPGEALTVHRDGDVWVIG